VECCESGSVWIRNFLSVPDPGQSPKLDKKMHKNYKKDKFGNFLLLDTGTGTKFKYSSEIMF
jgi:hypothetical protein